jgi:hypothetical protein
VGGETRVGDVRQCEEPGHDVGVLDVGEALDVPLDDRTQVALEPCLPRPSLLLRDDLRVPPVQTRSR